MHAVADQHSGHLGAVAAQAQGQPDRPGEGERGVVDGDAQLVDSARLVQHVGNRGL